MTEKIDLDELDVGEQDDGTGTSNPGDWIWRDGDSPDDPSGDETPVTGSDPSGDGPEADPDAADDGVAGEDGPGEDTGEDAESAAVTDAVPHVPRGDRKKPAGIPKSQGGSGGGTAGGTDAREPQHPEDAETGSRASGPHGGGVDDMTTAYTYEALQRVDDVQLALAETNEWSDWVGIVGEVAAHDINKLQRDYQVDVDFFNGSGSGPAERLADVGEHSMFYARRMVVVGTADQEWIAEESGWEFVPLADAAEGAGWEYDTAASAGE